MKKYISLLVILFSPFLSQSQQGDKLEYEQYENLAKNVSIILQYVNGKQCKIADNTFNLHFSNANFTFNYSNFTFNYIMGDDNYKEVIPNIDLSQVKSLYKLEGNYGDVGLIYISFNKNIPLTKITNGKVAQTELAEFPFFYSLNISMQGEGLLKSLSDLIFLSKVKKGVLTGAQAQTEQEVWTLASNSNTAQAYYKFSKNQPNSIFYDMSKSRLELMDRTSNIANINTGTFYLNMPQSEIYNIISDRVNNIHPKGRTFKIMKENLYAILSWEQCLGSQLKFPLHFISTSAGSQNNLDRFYDHEKLKKVKNELDDIFSSVAQSTNNELLSILPNGYKLRFLRCFSNRTTDSDDQIDFLIETPQGTICDYEAIAYKLIEKYGTLESKLYRLSTESGGVLIKGVGKYGIYLHPDNSRYWTTQKYVIAIFNKKKLEYAQIPAFDEYGLNLSND